MLAIKSGAAAVFTLKKTQGKWILDLPAGKDRVIAYNFNPVHRDLNRSDFRLLWNALLNWNASTGTPCLCRRNKV